MKYLYLLPLLLFLFTACSVDDSAELLDQEKNKQATMVASFTSPIEVPFEYTCFKGLTAHTNIDVSGGFTNPLVNFVSDAPATVSSTKGYRVKVIIQQLADCEDMDIVSGEPITLGTSVIYYNIAVTHPMVTVAPNQFPACYKWRLVVEGVSTSCKSYSPWYDAPLF